MSEASAPRDFIVVNAAEALSLLEEGAKNLSAAMIWTRDQKRVINTHLSLVTESDASVYFIIPKGLNPDALRDELAADGSFDCFFSISLVRANVFFRARFVGHHKATLQFQFPEKVFKVQRRNDIRFTIPDGYVVKVEFQDPLFPNQRIVFKASDISAGGFSFITPPADTNAWAAGLQLSKVTVVMNSLSVSMDGEVRHTTVMPPSSKTPGIKVGVQFKNIRPGDAQKIANYVFEESRRHYSKFL